MFLFILAGALLLAALVLALVSRWQRRSAGLPPGRVTYADPSLWGKVEKPLYDPETGLVGKPDYLVETKEGIIPVEVKSAPAPSNPYEGHVLQLAAYCYLVSKTTGKRPPYGLLNYRNRTFSIDFTPALEQKLTGADHSHPGCRAEEGCAQIARIPRQVRELRVQEDLRSEV